MKIVRELQAMLDQSSRASRVRAGAMLLLFLLMASMAGQVQLRNNGDGWRVLRSALIAAPPDYYVHQLFPQYMPFKPLAQVQRVELVPMSSTAAIVELISFIQRGLGCEQFNFLWVSRFYLALYLGGALLLLWRARLLVAVPALLLLLNPYILALFNAPFEEGLVIALIPLLCHVAVARGPVAEFASQAVALLITGSKVQFLPLLFSGIRSLQWRRNLVFLALGALLIAGISFKGSKFALVNSYNRYFNGMAYSMAGVSSWPAHDEAARRQLAMQTVRPEQVRFPADAYDARQYWGSSYWPVGDSLAPAQRDYLASHLRPWFWSTARANPGHAFRLLSEPVATAATADFRLLYLFHSNLPPALLAPYQLLTRHLGALGLLAICLSLFIAARRRDGRHLLYGLFLLGYPLLVVYGDGYYEFEKHMFAVVILSIVFPIAQLTAGQGLARRRAGRSPAPSLAPAA